MNNVLEDAQELRYSGIGYIRTRKPDEDILRMITIMEARAADMDVILKEVIVDDGNGMDIDREEIDRLDEWMVSDGTSIIFLRRLADVSRNKEEVEKFLRRAETFGVTVFCMEEQMICRANYSGVY